MTPTSRRAKPITWDGVEYPSQAALSVSLGMAKSAVSTAIYRGKLDSLGKDQTETRRKNGLLAHQARRQPVAAMGWSWPSQAAAALTLGVVESVVCRALQRGTFAALVERRQKGAAHAA